MMSASDTASVGSPPPRAIGKATLPIRAASALAVALVALVFLLYAQTGRHQFLTWDDPAYVTDNPHVSAGLTVAGVKWAFTHSLHGNWHPVTVVSHMIDVQLFGMKPAAHHLVNVLFHAANTVLLFAVLLSLTGAPLRSAFVAALFAVHPLNVETVAWIAERKSLLSLCFGLLSIAAYVKWVRRPTVGRYSAFLVCFALSLMSKPMLVTLPLLLLVLDLCVLRRISTWRSFGQRVFEKLPAFALSACCAVATMVAQRTAGAMSTDASLTLWERVTTATFSTAWYAAKMIWPSNLNCLYLHPEFGGPTVPIWQWIASIALVSGLSVAVVRCAKQDAERSMAAAAFMSGVLWYSISLLPVLGLIQVGYQSRADRYAYVPLIGLFVAIAFLPFPRRLLVAVAGVAVIVALSIAAGRQVTTWRSDESLYTRAVTVDATNWVMLNNLGAMYLDRGKPDQALGYLLRAVKRNPSHGPAWCNGGVAWVQMENYPQAIDMLTRGVALEPQNQPAWRNLAASYVGSRRYGEALDAARRALALDSDDPYALYWRGAASENLGDAATAKAAARRIREIAPQVARELGL